MTPIGIFQGDAPQFIVLSISIAMFIYINRLNWDYSQQANDINTARNARLALPESEGSLIEKLLSFSMLLFSFCNLVIIFRILVWRFISSLPEFWVLIIDYLILFYFLTLLFYSYQTIKLLKLKFKEDTAHFNNQKNMKKAEEVKIT